MASKINSYCSEPIVTAKSRLTKTISKSVSFQKICPYLYSGTLEKGGDQSPPLGKPMETEEAQGDRIKVSEDQVQSDPEYKVEKSRRVPK